MARRFHLPCWVLVVALASGAASAQAPGSGETPAEDAAKSVVGAWELSNAERDRSCTLTLKGNRIGAGPASAIDIDKKCAELFPFSRAAAGWVLGSRDAIRLVDAKGQPVLEFTEVESGLYEAERPGEGLLFLQNVAAAAGDGGERTAEQVAGDWELVREGGGKALCRLTLSNTAAGGNSIGFALQLRPGCNAVVTRFAPSGWRLDRGQLVLLSSRADSWRFEESDPTTWRRIPEGTDPLRLVRVK